MYWTDEQRPVAPTYATHNIRRANLDGSNIETLIMAREDIFDVALDLVGGKMYWMGFDNGIQRASLDGSNIETLVPIQGNMYSIALDVVGGKMYWTHTGHIQRANLDGSHVETLVHIQGTISGLALDMVGDKMYWVEIVSRALANASSLKWDIKRANMDGSNIETLLTRDGRVPSIALGSYEPTSYELANSEQIQTRSRQEARSELGERGIPYSQRSFVTYAQNGDLDVVRLFIEAGLDVNVQPYSASSVYIPTQEDVKELDDLKAVWFP